MKKTSILLIIILGTVVPRTAAAETGLGLGIKGGPCLSKVNWNLSLAGSSETTSRRLTAGVFAEIDLSPWFAVQPELDFVTMGYTWSDALGSGTNKHLLQYLQIPVLLKARLVRKGRVVPAVFAGPSLGILLRARFRYYDVSGGGPGYSLDIKDAYRDFDLGVTFGAGANMRVRNIKLIFDVRYYLGLTDVDRSADSSVKNTGLMITGGLGF